MITFKPTPLKDFIKSHSPTNPTQEVIERFSKKIELFLQKANTQDDEEFQKNEINKLLAKVYGYDCNTKGKIDSAIYVDGEAQVLIEVKALANKNEFAKSSDNPLSKALCESILYFLREIKQGNNNSIKHIILCNPCEFFIFDAKKFLLFAEDKTIKKLYKNCDDKEGVNTKTEKFYADLESYLQEGFEGELPFAYFSLANLEQHKQLSLIYQLLSPQVLLKEVKTLDANTLNKGFYEELLYILGLQEVSENGKSGGKILIIPSKRENTLSSEIKRHYKLNDEEIFTLLTTWNNRILFLRLLESMLLSFQHISKPFLHLSIIKDFKTLQTLFFEVLAKKSEDRSSSLLKELLIIPYLNSSLFDPIALEREGKHIGGLDSMPVALFSHSILRKKDERFKNKESLPLLEYLFEFLHAYDFTTTAKDIAEGVKQNHDKLINSAVLGLVFEKLNGYKEGSFYTPSFITSYMCKESITQAVIEKFNQAYKWEATSLEEISSYSIRCKLPIQELLSILLSLRICDPAVGSGHFLVSALNEIVKIAYELGLISSFKNNTTLELENDEILIKTHNELFTYTRPSSPQEPNHKIQEELFTLKKSIIENCLFGVDINPNSCEITKLRLWIELLKYSYYIFNEEGENTNALETLPNIDINIKCGNSLISYFDLKQSVAHYPNIKTRIQNYKQMVSDYKKGFFSDKTKLSSQIEELLTAFQKFCFKDKYKKEIQTFQKQCDKYRELYGNYLAKDDRDLALCISDNPFPVYEHIDETQEIHKQAKADFSNLKQAYNALYNLSSNNPFEWRFEFPEVLDEEGNFLGFDVVIGNPPYITTNKKDYPKYKWSTDLYMMFFEVAFGLVKAQGLIHYIVPRFWLVNKDAKNMRDFMLNSIDLISLTESNPFESAVTENIITLLKNQAPISSKFQHYKETNEIFNFIKDIEKDYFKNNQNKEIILGYTPELLSLLEKIEQNTISLGEISQSKRGVEFGKDFIKLNSKNGDRKVLMGYEVRSYSIEWQQTLIKSSLPEVERMNSFFDEDNLIFLRRVDSRLTASISNEKYAFIKNLYGIQCSSDYYRKLILALLNSKMMNFYYLSKFTTKKEKVFPEIQTYLFNQLPIKIIAPENEFLINKIIAIVEQILALKDSNPQADTQELEKEIDSLVYTLYNLTDEEIAIIEGGK